MHCVKYKIVYSHRGLKSRLTHSAELKCPDSSIFTLAYQYKCLLRYFFCFLLLLLTEKDFDPYRSTVSLLSVLLAATASANTPSAGEKTWLPGAAEQLAKVAVADHVTAVALPVVVLQ